MYGRRAAGNKLRSGCMFPPGLPRQRKFYYNLVGLWGFRNLFQTSSPRWTEFVDANCFHGLLPFDSWPPPERGLPKEIKEFLGVDEYDCLRLLRCRRLFSIRNNLAFEKQSNPLFKGKADHLSNSRKCPLLPLEREPEDFWKPFQTTKLLLLF